MSGDAAFKIELAYAPETVNDMDAWRARVFLADDDFAPKQVVWGRSRDSALAHARLWVKQQKAHGDPETVLLDANGDLIPQPQAFSERVAR